MPELGGGQAGGFNSPYRANLANDVNRQTIRITAPQLPAEIAEPTEAATPVLDKQEIANEVLQRRLDSQRIHREVADNRAEVDSYTSREEAGNARSDRVSRFTDHPFNIKEQEQRQHRERLARNLNEASVGLRKAIDGDVPEDQHLVSHAAQSAEDIDPDAKARKDLDKKLKKIIERGGDKGKDFARFVESQKDAKGLLSDSIQELVDGYIETLRGDSLTPAEMVDGEHSLRFIADKIDPNNVEEMQALRHSIATAHGSSTSLKSELYELRQLQDRNKVRIKPPEMQLGEVELSNHERAIGLIVNLPQPPWLNASLQLV